MHKRTTSGERPRDKQEGQTLPVQGESQQGVPRMPHERDESADSQSANEPSARAVGQAAHDDLQRGLVDTDKGPALDKAYDKVREGATDPVKKFRP
jgi:hypothetical protein